MEKSNFNLGLMVVGNVLDRSFVLHVDSGRILPGYIPGSDVVNATILNAYGNLELCFDKDRFEKSCNCWP